MTQGGTPPAVIPIFYRINIVRISGRRATLEPGGLTHGNPRPSPLKEVGCIGSCGDSGEGKQSFLRNPIALHLLICSNRTC